MVAKRQNRGILRVRAQKHRIAELILGQEADDSAPYV